MKIVTLKFVRLGMGRRRAATPSFFSLGFLALLFSACLLDPDRTDSSRVWDGTPGFVQLNIGLDRNQQHGLSKLNAADTTFGLDSLIVVLTATGADTLTYRYAINGRPDTGVIALNPMIYTLNPLLNWKARFYSIDTTVSPVRRDTVHFDSIIFAVKPADTAFVTKTVASAFSMVRTRFISKASSMAFLGTSIRYLRLKVGGVTRDSVELFGSENKAVWFATPSTGWIVQDSGRVFRTIDSGASWYPQSISSTTNLRAVSFADVATGWVGGENGLLKKTTDSGNTWTTQSLAGNTQHINALRFISTTNGYAVTDSGKIYRTINGGSFWWLVSVLRGWFESPNTSADLNDVGFVSATTGFAVGSGGIIRTTTNNGTSWSSSGTAAQTLNAVSMYSASNGYAAGNVGVISRYNGATWSSQTSGTTQTLHGVHVRGSDSAWAVGASETLTRNTTNGGGGWSVVPGGWQTRTAAPASHSWFGVSFGSSTTGYIVGAGGTIRRSTDGGATWGTVTVTGTARTRPLRDVWAFSATNAIAAGDSGLVARTTTGTSWNWVSTGAGNVQLNGVAMASATVGWVVGASNTIRSTNNTGSSWSNRTQSGTWYGVSVSSARVFVAGSGGVVRRSTSLAQNTNFNTSVSNGDMGTTTLYGVAFSSNNPDTGYVVGAAGAIYRTVNASNNTASAVDWTNLTSTSPTASDILGVRFINGRTGWIVNRNGGVWRTTDAAASWTKQYHPNATDSLRNVWARSVDTAYLVGSGGAIRTTTTAGILISGKSTPQTLKGVFFPTSMMGYIVGSGGTITKTTDAGLRWTAQTNADTDTLNGVHFVHTDTGWAVGNNGTILKTVNGGTSWSNQTVGSAHLTRVRFVNSQRGWATGTGGTILYTADGGATWTAQTSGTTARLAGLHAFDLDTVYAVGAGGVIRKTVSAGNAFATSANHLKALAVNASTVYAVGQGGAAYRSNDSGKNWKTLTGSTANFNGVFASANFGYMVADGGIMRQIFNQVDSTVLRVKTTGTTKNLKAISGSPSGTASVVVVVGDSGTVGRFNTYAGSVALDTGSFFEDFRGVHCTPAFSNCLLVGTRESILRNNNPSVAGWVLMSMGAKRFDVTLSSKYLRPGVTDTVVMQAIDRVSPLRGYQRILGLTVGAGQDSTLPTTGLTQCGYGGLTPACIP